MDTATARWVGGKFQTAVLVRNRFELQADEVPQVGGTDTGPMPSELLIAAQAACMCMAVAHSARKRGVALPDLEVEARGYDAEAGFHFGRIEIVVRSSLPLEQLAPIVEVGRHYCYVTNTLQRGCPVEITASSDK